jgi:hypothetical protein
MFLEITMLDYGRKKDKKLIVQGRTLDFSYIMFCKNL